MSSLFLAVSAQAANSWIQVVGIDEAHPEQNYEIFYRVADEFNEACSKSKLSPNCTLFINGNPSLARQYDDPNQAPKNFNFKNNVGTPTYESVMTKMKDSVLSAKPGDTVVISLSNHGAPWRSASCVWVSSQEQICDADVKSILDQKPKGVKVVISAYACFSGAFADLSSSEICTMTSASRYALGRVAGRGLWNAINERFPKALSDLREPIIAESGQQTLLGSQVILQDLCSEARQKLSPAEVISQIRRNDSYTVFQSNQCRDADNSAIALTNFSRQVLKLTNSQYALNCRDLKVPEFVCNSLQKLKKAEPSLKTEITRSMEIQVRQQGLNESALKMIVEQKPEMDRFSEIFENLTPQEKSEITESIQLGIEPDWSKFNPQIGKKLQSAYEHFKGIAALNRKNAEVIKETDAIYARLRTSGLYDDLMNVQNCLTENEPTKESTESPWAEGAKKFQPRKFTLKDYEDAKKCEASISF